MNIRPFKNEDAKFCQMTRSSNFIKLFSEDLGLKVTHAAVDAYTLKDYIDKAATDNHKIFIVEQENKQVGFFMIKKHDLNTAEIPLIFIDDMFHHKGLGKQSMEYIEQWIKKHWSSVQRIYLDTIIPEYNSQFYIKMGYSDLGASIVRLCDLSVKAKRFEKLIK